MLREEKWSAAKEKREKDKPKGKDAVYPRTLAGRRGRPRERRGKRRASKRGAKGMGRRPVAEEG